LGCGDTVDANCLFGARVACNDFDVARGDAEGIGEELADSFVGAAIFGRGGDFDFEAVGVGADDLVPAGVGDDFEVDEAGRSGGVVGEHGREGRKACAVVLEVSRQS
jgi:hypothetical protein